jgi:hypothetical protein
MCVYMRVCLCVRDDVVSETIRTSMCMDVCFCVWIMSMDVYLSSMCMDVCLCVWTTCMDVYRSSMCVDVCLCVWIMCMDVY